MEIFYVLDASAFINGFQMDSKNNFTVPEITFEIKDFESRLKFDEAIDESRLIIQDVPEKYLKLVDEIISKSGDSLRLSFPDKKLISLAYMMCDEGKDVKVITDDLLKGLKEFTIGKKFVKVVKRNMMTIILLMIVKFADQKYLKKELR